MEENSHLDKKSINIIKGTKADWKELAKDCVCFANGVGGNILIGIEDKDELPNSNQKINDKLIEDIQKKIPSLTLNVAVFPEKIVAENGGEYIKLKVLRSQQTIASTTDGRYYMRVSDECRPVLPDELARLAADKNAFVWEEKVVKKIPLEDCDITKFNGFLKDIRNSERVSQFIKDKEDEDLAEQYFLINNGLLTNLGVLWIGKRLDRATLHYAPSVQFIKYDENDKKVYKKVWDDFSLNPKELLSEILNEIPDWNEFIEVSDGLFRKNIYNYPPEVIRELLVNAFAHRNYTMRGDIFINLYSDRLEIHSPGLLPLGVTPDNILTKSVQRNYLLSKLFYDLKIMEKEGSGYDRVYELLLGNGKQLPEVFEGDDRVVVTIKKQITNNEVLKLMDKASKSLQLKQKELIALGIIAQNDGISAIELTKILNIAKPNGLQSWLAKLLDMSLVLVKGKTKATFYYIDPDFLRVVDFVEKTTLKRIEPHRLQELIYEDLKNYPASSISEINKRIGEDINSRSLKAKLDDMIAKGLIFKEGERKGTLYFINKNA